jgi:hypothetical protein
VDEVATFCHLEFLFRDLVNFRSSFSILLEVIFLSGTYLVHMVHILNLIDQS